MKESLSALELGFIILSVHYISSAASAPFNAIYQSPVLPSFFFLFSFLRTGASILSQGHETALSLWSPSPSKKNPSITTPGQRLTPTALPSDIT